MNVYIASGILTICAAVDYIVHPGCYFASWIGMVSIPAFLAHLISRGKA